MKVLFSRHIVAYTILIICVVLGMLYFFIVAYPISKHVAASDTVTVNRNPISILVSVSGKLEAKDAAVLTFPRSGIVQHIFKNEGDQVAAGEILASLTQDSYTAEYTNALHNLQFEEAAKAALLQGPRAENREVWKTTVLIAKENLARTEREQAQKVANALAVLQSTDLEAVPEKESNDDTPPTVSGNYTCKTPGTYILSLYKSKAESGISITLSGLESGRYEARTETPTPLGSCGLYIKFDPNENYRPGIWTISIPNTRGASYIANKNAYELALKTEQNALDAAREDLTLAEQTELDNIADPTPESIAQADARIAAARSLFDLKKALIEDYTIRAPFDGVLTESNLKIGEVSNGSRSMTVLREGFYELKARIPEVDIPKVTLGNSAFVYFDARPNEGLKGTVEYISPYPIDIDGVSYYEARINLAESPTWIRPGFNADIEIATEAKENVLSVPKRFLTKKKDAYYGFRLTPEDTLEEIIISTGIEGTEGYIEVTNLEEGTVLANPSTSQNP